MHVLVIRRKATEEEVKEMSRSLGQFIKLAVDISQNILAGGGPLHADCESALIEQGSRQEDIWGADWIPGTKQIRFEAMINLAPRRKNRSMEIQDPRIRARVEAVIRNLLG